jgi:hypothetical protein
MSLVKEFHTANDLAKSDRLFFCEEKVRVMPSSFSAFSRSSSYWLPISGSNNGSKFHKQLALLLFGDQMGKQSCENRKGVIRCRQPFPYWIFVLFIYSYSSLQSFFDVFDQLGLAVTSFYRSAESKFFCWLRFAFPTVKTPIAFHESGEPLVKFFIRNNDCINFKFFNRRRNRGFAIRNFSDKFLSYFFSFFSRVMKVFTKKNKLSFFDYGKFLYFGDESFLIFYQRIPGENFFFVLSFARVDGTSKIFFEKMCRTMTCDSKSDPGISSRSQRNTSFSIKESCKKPHHSEILSLSSIMSGNDIRLQRLNPGTQG